MIRELTEDFSVAPQIAPGDIAAIKAAGFVAIVNNRPDDEESGQSAGDAIRAAAEDQGLAYTAIPVGGAGMAMPQVEAMAAAIDAAGGPVLAFCRSGTRSCNLWALAAVKGGLHPDTAMAKAAAAGYDLTSLRPVLDHLFTQR